MKTKRINCSQELLYILFRYDAACPTIVLSQLCPSLTPVWKWNKHISLLELPACSILIYLWQLWKDIQAEDPSEDCGGDAELTASGWKLQLFLQLPGMISLKCFVVLYSVPKP